MAEQNTIREADNRVVIEGTLLEVRGGEWKNGEGVGIELDIEVAENEVHTVHAMSRYKKKDGSDNSIAKGIQTVLDEYLSVAKHGRENADKVRITQGRLGLNDFYGEDGQLRSFPRITTNFINRLKADEEFNPRAEFELEIFVKSVIPEVKGDEETGRVKVNAIIPLYGGRVIPFEFVVTEEGSDFVEDNYEAGTTTRVFGDIVNFKEVIEKEVPVAFGKPQKKVTHNFIREYLITGGTEPYDEDSPKAFSVEAIKKAMVERETYLQQLKEDSKHQDKNVSNGRKNTFGNGSTGTKEENKKPKIDLPF
jgi:hypothetical protein